MANYRPVWLLPICGKIFERLIFNPVFEFLKGNKLLSPNQFGFGPNDSCENQLLSIVHSIYADFDQSPSLEVRANFLGLAGGINIQTRDCWNFRQFPQNFSKCPQ